MNILLINITDEALKELDDLTDRLGLANRTATIKKALSVLKFLVDEQVKGSKIILKYDDREIIIL